MESCDTVVMRERRVLGGIVAMSTSSMTILPEYCKNFRRTKVKELFPLLHNMSATTMSLNRAWSYWFTHLPVCPVMLILRPGGNAIDTFFNTESVSSDELHKQLVAES